MADPSDWNQQSRVSTPHGNGNDYYRQKSSGESDGTECSDGKRDQAYHHRRI